MKVYFDESKNRLIVDGNEYSPQPINIIWSTVEGEGDKVLIKATNDTITIIPFVVVTDILDVDNVAYASRSAFETALSRFLRPSVDVNVQDQTTPVIISQLNQKKGDTTLAAAIVIEDTSITVADATGIAAEDLIVISSPDGRTYVGKVTDITGAPVLVLDTPVNFPFDNGTVVNFGTTKMNVNGSLAAPQIFSVRGTGGDIPVTLDITRIIFTMVTATPVDLLKFGDLAILINGLVLRRKDGTISNIVNIKSNAGFANISYDFRVYEASNPQQGVDGLVCRLTFAGQNKMGVSIRLAPGEDFQVLVQDALSGITEFSTVVEGHVAII